MTTDKDAAVDPDAPVTMLALNADKTAVVEAESGEAAFLVREDELDDHLVKPVKKGKGDQS